MNNIIIIYVLLAIVFFTQFKKVENFNIDSIKKKTGGKNPLKGLTENNNFLNKIKGGGISINLILILIFIAIIFF